MPRYQKSLPKAVETVRRDWDRMVTFFAFPKQHWVHLRATDVVELPSSAIRPKADAARRCQRVDNATAMIWKLLKIAEKSWRRLKEHQLLAAVREGEKIINGLSIKGKSRVRVVA